MTLTETDRDTLATLNSLFDQLQTYRITILEHDTGYRAHTTTLRCTKQAADDLANAFLVIWPSHLVMTDRLA